MNAFPLTTGHTDRPARKGETHGYKSGAERRTTTKLLLDVEIAFGLWLKDPPPLLASFHGAPHHSAHTYTLYGG